jgi:hypothetical protein
MARDMVQCGCRGWKSSHKFWGTVSLSEIGCKASFTQSVSVEVTIWQHITRTSSKFLKFCWPCISKYACNETNLMHSLSSFYLVTITLRVSGLPVAYYQEVAICICDNWYVLYALVECRRDRQSQLSLYRETCKDICIVLTLSETANWWEWKYMEKRLATFTVTLRLLDFSSSAVSARVYDIAHSKMWQRLVTSCPMNMRQTVWVFSWNQCQDCKSVLYKIYCI